MSRAVTLASLLIAVLAGPPVRAKALEADASEPDLAAVSARITRMANWRRYDANGEPIPQVIFRPGERVQAHGLGVDPTPSPSASSSGARQVDSSQRSR
jgi:hypothetical protein